jgi:NUMOD4 motif./HNH endonuclease.
MNWKPLFNFEELYEINEFGDVRNVSMKQGRKKGLLTRHLQKGYRSNIKDREYYKLRKDGKNYTIYVHIAMAKTFIKNPNKLPQVNHIDGNPMNNKLDNLEWCDALTNVRHAFENNLIKTSKPVLQFTKSGEFVAEHPSESMACRKMMVGQGKVRNSIIRKGLCKGYRWEYKVKA